MQKLWVLGICWLGLCLSGCQSKENEEEAVADFEKMVIIQEDRVGQEIGSEESESLKMR